MPDMTRFGHLFYAEAPEAALGDVGEYRQTGRLVRLLPAAAAAFGRLREAAARDGMALVPISGFRTHAYQESLFLKAVAKYGSEAAAARWVAPAGCSEHHTGLALDIGAESRPEADVESVFEETPESGWLRRRAPDFGFELSFPRDNPQGIAYEPWHWRFIG
ncbi:MAG TPA: M15 family metallopeptidase, partial [Methylomirabilota bacterium]|nr:M15 family metallopeptidase [Methylomirabilota bacterium]